MALTLWRRSPTNPTKKDLVVSTFLLSFAPTYAIGKETHS